MKTALLRDWNGACRRVCRRSTGIRNAIVSVGLLVLPVFVTGQEVGGSQTKETLPPAVQEQLERQAAAMGNSSITYKETITFQTLPRPTRETPYYEYRDGKRFYQRFPATAQDYRGNPLLSTNEVSFDGSQLFVASPGWSGSTDPLPVVIKERLDDMTDPIRNAPQFNSPFLQNVGFYTPTSIDELTTHSFPESLVLYCIEQADSSKVEMVEGKMRVTVSIPDAVLLRAGNKNLAKERKRLESMVEPGNSNFTTANVEQQMEALETQKKLKPVRKIVFDLDPQRGYAITSRTEWTGEGKHIADYVSDNWQHYTHPDIWLPNIVTVTYYTFPDELTTFSETPFMIDKVKLDKIEFNKTEPVQFTLDNTADYKRAGTHIVDRSSDAAKTNKNHRVDYMISRDGSLIKYSHQLASVEMHNSSVEMHKRSHRLVIIFILGLMILPVALWLVRQKFSKR